MTQGRATSPKRAFQRDPESKRAQILAVARRLFSEQSYEATTTAEIARLAGVAEGSVFHHFRNKPDLLRAVADEYGRDLSECMFGSSGEDMPSFRDCFERAYGFICDEGLPAFTPGRSPELQRIVYEVLQRRMVEHGEEVLEEMARRDLVRPMSAPMVARWIFTIFASLLADALCHGRSAVSEKQLAEAARWIEGGVGMRRSVSVLHEGPAARGDSRRRRQLRDTTGSPGWRNW